METLTLTLEQALADLDRMAPGVPLLALGQTVFWDEPMKAGVALASNRKFIAGVHDTDYFAKLPGEKQHGHSFRAVPHNDTRTKGLWSAAAEFSALFGSETVISKETLHHYGVRLEKISHDRPTMLDEATEAWGWRGVVSTSDETPITAEVALDEVYSELHATLQWAIDGTLDCISEPERLLAQDRVNQLEKILTEARGQSSNLAEFYRRLLPSIYNFVASDEVPLEATQTTSLLKFNFDTSHLPRFEIVDRFLRPASATLAREAYNDCVRGSEIYTLDRFMSGAIPFELVVPGKGRGTIRVAPRAVIIMTPKPIFIGLKRPIESVHDLAEAIEQKLGPDCTLIGKAVTLIGMLAREFVFVFHEGASGYVKRSRALHARFQELGIGFPVNPILRIHYHVWDALAHCYSWLKLPAPLQGPFGADEICAPSFSARWREVASQQTELLTELGQKRRPIDLIRFLEGNASASWKCLAREYEGLLERLQKLESSVAALKIERVELYRKLAHLKQDRVAAERAKGEQWRAEIFRADAPAAVEPNAQAWARRAELTAAVEHTIHEIAAAKQRIRELLAQQKELSRDPEVRRIHQRRQSIELEAEMKRLKLIRSAIIASKGLANASLRPSAWWFPLLCPDGDWFRETIRTAECYLEPLV